MLHASFLPTQRCAQTPLSVRRGLRGAWRMVRKEAGRCILVITRYGMNQILCVTFPAGATPMGEPHHFPSKVARLPGERATGLSVTGLKRDEEEPLSYLMPVNPLSVPCLPPSSRTSLLGPGVSEPRFVRRYRRRSRPLRAPAESLGSIEPVHVIIGNSPPPPCQDEQRVRPRNTAFLSDPLFRSTRP